MTGQQLLDRWIAFMRRYIVLTDAQALVVVLWTINTWVYDRFGAVPFLEVVATTKRSGKTSLLKLLQWTCRGSEKFAFVTSIKVICRMIEAYEGKVTILVDEAETLSRSSLGEMRAGMADGYKPGGQHAISVGKTFARFRTYAPWAFALIGNVHDVLRDRCIEIELERSVPPRVLAEYEDEAKNEAKELIAALVDWSKVQGAKHGGKLHIPIVPADWLHGRERELWTPLVSVASWLGLHADQLRLLQSASVDFGMLKLQPAKVWHSAQDEQDAEERDMAERALTDARSVFAPGEAFIPSAVLVDRMRALPKAPWRSWRVHGLNEVLLATLMDRYGIGPVVQRVGKGRKESKTLRGYRAVDVNKAKA